MTAAEIIERLKTDKKLENEEFSISLIDFESEDFKIAHLGSQEYRFINCTFERGIEFLNLDFGNFASLKFEHCIFNGNTSFKQFDIKNLSFENCNFKLSLSFGKIVSYEGKVSIHSCEIGGVFRLDEIQSDYISINEIETRFCFLSQIKSMRILINNIVKEKEIGELRFEQKIEVENIDVYAKKTIEKIEIQSCVNIHLFGDFDLITIHNDDFLSINVNSFSSNSESMGIIDKISFKNWNFKGNLTFSNLSIENLNLKNLTSLTAVFSFTNVIIKYTSIENVKASKFYLDLVEFKNELKIKNSDLSGLKPNNVTWLPNQVISPDNTKRKIPWLYRIRKKIHDDELITELKQQRDAYRQLKIASQNNHNQIDALAFYRNEMRLYWKEIRLVGGISRSNRILVFLNRWMSDFGQNYWLPLMWILIFQTIFSVLIWNFEADPNCKIDFCTGFADYKLGIADYITWINPIFKAPEDWSSGAKITSFFMRIFNGFFIYHFIKAIRKYGKGE